MAWEVGSLPIALSAASDSSLSLAAWARRASTSSLLFFKSIKVRVSGLLWASTEESSRMG